ncbi:MAG TPA: helix-turn-helix transcriptional regulator [Rhizomicrobium sp.]|jgi:AraC-like DNA-binding protein
MSQAQPYPGDSQAPFGKGPAGFQISTDELPRNRRLPAINDRLAQAPFGTQIEVLGDQPLRGLLVERSLPGLDLNWSRNSPIRVTRAGPLLTRGSDNILLQLVTCPRSSTQFGREFSLKSGEGMAVGNAGPGCSAYPSPSKQVSVIVSQHALRPLLRDRSTHFVRLVPPDSGALQLLVGYLDALKNAIIPPELEHTIVAHVHDLIAVALGATPDGVEIANGRGVRAARLRAIKSDALKGLAGDLSLGALAARHRLTERSVQMLFEDAGTTFTAFVRDQRLERARRMLASPRFDHLRITDIALEVGFGDISYFIRAFRRRFGLSPGDARGRPLTNGKQG